MDGFAKEIRELTNETLALKTNIPKTATMLATKEEDVTLDFHLALIPPKNVEAESETRRVTLTAPENMITAIYLNPTDDASGYDTRGRTIGIIPREGGTETVYDIYVYSQTDSDIGQLISGMSVTVTLSFKIVGTSDYTLTTT